MKEPKKIQMPSGKDHWEKKYNPNFLKDDNKKLGSEFNPRQSKTRMTTYTKVNETDH